MPTKMKQNHWLILVTLTSVVFAIVVNHTKSGNEQSMNQSKPLSLSAETGHQHAEQLKQNVAHGD
ncbi:hypothetical protein GCM10008090_05420 [Arenicella chitinivorans]|uniref:Uncharacterized protein n=1 Tax=Arenicella chitinivorans TaxID=1329800 RepID=A0A918RJR1_9GAMM|nr:hypothetical protein [Arenicella chitinivorans]GGZ99693.1 hypothetical protein GCM10008090_05420 [Arenicella chitinivorans]